MDEPCNLCPTCSFYGFENKEDSHDLFHRPCLDCTSHYTHKEYLCDICQHLRLPHLLNCVSPQIRQQYRLPLRQGLLEVDTTKCPLCNIVIDTIKSSKVNMLATQTEDSDYEIILTFEKLQETDSAVSITIKSHQKMHPTISASGLLNIEIFWKENIEVIPRGKSFLTTYQFGASQHIGQLRIDDIKGNISLLNLI